MCAQDLNFVSPHRYILSTNASFSPTPRPLLLGVEQDDSVLSGIPMSDWYFFFPASDDRWVGAQTIPDLNHVVLVASLCLGTWLLPPTSAGTRQLGFRCNTVTLPWGPWHCLLNLQLARSHWVFLPEDEWEPCRIQLQPPVCVLSTWLASQCCNSGSPPQKPISRIETAWSYCQKLM